MLQSLGRIQNPLARSLTAAATIGATLTMAGAIAIGSINAKSDKAYRTALYSVLMGTSCGAIFGLLYADRKSQREKVQFAKSTQHTVNHSWKEWRKFVVVRKVKESEEITSFYLKPEDQQAIPSFVPGQFLTIQLNIPGYKKPIIRNYSLSDYAEPCEYYRISVKREPTPAGWDVMPGVASGFMHDRIQEGSVIDVKPPGGKFVFDPHQPLPAVLISNGVGITPMMSMIKAALHHNSDRPIWFVHGARNSRFHAFQKEVLSVVNQNPNLHIHFAYSNPQAEDAGYYHSTGYVNIELIQSLVQQDAEYFLCGSPGFMQSLRDGLKAAGVSDSRVFFEAFTKGSSSTPAVGGTNGSLSDKSALTNAEVVFTESSKIATWRSGDGSLLEFAETNHLEPLYSCRRGICGTCACQILEGEVNYQEPPGAIVEDGSILICISQPKTSRVVLKL